MQTGRADAVAAGLLALTVLTEVVAVTLSWGLEPAFDTAVYAVSSVVTAFAGALVASRRPENPIGWLLVGFALLSALAADLAQGWGLRAVEQGWPAAAAAELVAVASWVPSGFGWTLTFLLFPTGHLLSRRWRWVVLLAALGMLLAVPGWALSPERHEEFGAGTNPFAVAGLPTGPMTAVGVTLVVVGLVGSWVALGLRLRRSDGVERQQLKWFVYAAALTVTFLPLSFALWYVTPLARILPAVALTAVPVAACVAILRHRLYDIDAIIDRTVVYAVLTAVLTASFLTVTFLLGTALGRGSVAATAAATLVVAVAFAPARGRLQSWVDRQFHRARFEAVRRTTGYIEALRAGRERADHVQDVLRDVLGDPGLELLVYLPQSRVYVDVAGCPSTTLGVLRHETAVERSGSPLALVRYDAALDGELLRRVVDAAGLAIEILRLDVELHRHLGEVEASRARIAAAGLEERRRIERNLHDGAQQRLVAIGLALRHAQHELDRSRGRQGSEVSALLDTAVDDVAATISELRELSRGLPPAQLDAGLRPAFRDLAQRSPLPVKVDVPSERFDPGLEGAAWFIGCEGVTNAVKHSGARTISLRASHLSGALVVTVTDDGMGGAVAAPGSGLSGLADRVAALGGALTITSPPGAGTTLTAELPCGS